MTDWENTLFMISDVVDDLGVLEIRMSKNECSAKIHCDGNTSSVRLNVSALLRIAAAITYRASEITEKQDR